MKIPLRLASSGAGGQFAHLALADRRVGENESLQALEILDLGKSEKSQVRRTKIVRTGETGSSLILFSNQAWDIPPRLSSAGCGID
jgi:hypothetical protein